MFNVNTKKLGMGPGNETGGVCRPTNYIFNFDL